MGTLIRKNEISVFVSILISLNSFAFTSDTLRNGQIDNHSSNPQYEKLQNALQDLYEIQKNGGWPKIIAKQKFYLKGQSAPAIKQIKDRLRITGDFSSDDTTEVFTIDLVMAVVNVQKRFGCKPNGVVDANLIKELNIPVESRIQQLLLNMNRFQQMPLTDSATRLVVNIPEYKLHVYEGSQHIFDMEVVVGSEEHKTVLFDDEMTNVVFSPYWNVPPKIVENELLPAMRRTKNYLRNNGYEITGYEAGLPVIRQKPGLQNALGQVKFVFPNDHGIYFHDTPAKGLFQHPKRAFSHGCIRLSEPYKLAQYILKNVPGWTSDKIWNAMAAGTEQWVKLPKPVEVSITYYTAWVDAGGLLNFRQDVYGLDTTQMNIANLSRN